MKDRNDTAERTVSPNDNREPVSALVDGELDRGGAEFVLRRLIDDEGMHDHWQRCHLVRACLQHEFEGPVSLVGRVQAALENENAPERKAAMSSLMRFGLGGAIAAGVAIFAVTGLNYRMSQEGSNLAQPGDSSGFVSQSTALDRQFNAEAVPAGFGARSSDDESRRESGGLQSQQRINRYMIRHSQAAGSTGFNSLTPVLTAPEVVRLAPPASEEAANRTDDDRR